MTVNIFFTNWRRRSHLYRIIEAIKSQTLVPNIFVIDNASTDPENRFELSSEYVKTIKNYSVEDIDKLSFSEKKSLIAKLCRPS